MGPQLSFVHSWRVCLDGGDRRADSTTPPLARLGQVRVHLTGMGISYILMLTAFYVDNGKNLPLWRELPQWAFWVLPAAVGVPIIVYVMLRHPLMRRAVAR